MTLERDNQGKVIKEYDIKQQDRTNAIYDEVLPEVLKKIFTGSTEVIKAKMRDDRKGTDFWVGYVNRETGQNGRPAIRVDIKIQYKDPMVKFGKSGHTLPLEIWSNIERKKVGWTLDQSKHTDYVVWWFQPTGRTVTMPFPMLVNVFNKFCDEWLDKFPATTQKTNKGNISWHSQVVHVPVREIWKEIYNLYSGANLP